VIHRQRGYYSVYNYRIRVLNYRPQLSVRVAPDYREPDGRKSFPWVYNVEIKI
jgi:hypothetical protein